MQAVIASRIDRFPREEKLLLQQASVIGIDVPLVLLEAVTQVPDEVARRALRSLQTASFIYQTNLFPDLEYRFRHVLTRDVAYSSLLKDQRRPLHAQAFAAIERLYPDYLASHLDDLAVHAVRGELWDKAVAYNRQLAMRAQKRGANPEAVSCFEEALRALAHLPSTRETVEMEIDLRSALRPALLQLGRLDEVLAVSRQVERLALELRPAAPGAGVQLSDQLSLPQGRVGAHHRLRGAVHSDCRGVRGHGDSIARAAVRRAGPPCPRRVSAGRRKPPAQYCGAGQGSGDHAVRLLLRVACVQPGRAR